VSSFLDSPHTPRRTRVRSHLERNTRTTTTTLPFCPQDLKTTTTTLSEDQGEQTDHRQLNPSPPFQASRVTTRSLFASSVAHTREASTRTVRERKKNEREREFQKNEEESRERRQRPLPSCAAQHSTQTTQTHEENKNENEKNTHSHIAAG
jgi:hypothetical protein